MLLPVFHCGQLLPLSLYREILTSVEKVSTTAIGAIYPTKINFVSGLFMNHDQPVHSVL